jgi:hypothetical protein
VQGHILSIGGDALKPSTTPKPYNLESGNDSNIFVVGLFCSAHTQFVAHKITKIRRAIASRSFCLLPRRPTLPPPCLL